MAVAQQVEQEGRCLDPHLFRVKYLTPNWLFFGSGAVCFVLLVSCWTTGSGAVHCECTVIVVIIVMFNNLISSSHVSKPLTLS